MTDLERQISAIDQGQHLCLLYEDAAEQLAAVVPYLTAGLQRRERCLYLADDRTIGEVGAALDRAGVDVGRHVATGALAFVTARDAYLVEGAFDVDRMIGFLAKALDEAVADGWNGLRSAGEMTWCLAGDDPGAVIEYEARLNDVLPGTRALALCQYNRRRFPPALIYDVLRTHPAAVIGQQVCPNHFYEPPELVIEQCRKADRVEWRIAQLRRARSVEQALEESSRVRSDFLAAMSHDLRTPLNAIMGYAEIVRGGLAGELGAKQQQMVAKIAANAAHLAHMIDEILAFAKMEGGHEELLPERVTLTRLVHEAAAAVRPLAEAKGLDLVVDVKRRRVVLCTDRGKVRKVLLNLLSNAIKYTDAGTVTFAAHMDAADDPWCIFEVRDTGRGIAQEHLDMIFEPFWRVRGSKQSGTGLGLSVTRRLAHLIGGDIAVQSIPGVGSTFTVRIPAVLGGASMPQAEALTEAVPCA